MKKLRRSFFCRTGDRVAIIREKILNLKNLSKITEQVINKQQISKCCTLKAFVEKDDIHNYNLGRHSKKRPFEKFIR